RDARPFRNAPPPAGPPPPRAWPAPPRKSRLPPISANPAEGVLYQGRTHVRQSALPGSRIRRDAVRESIWNASPHHHGCGYDIEIRRLAERARVNGATWESERTQTHVAANVHRTRAA